MKTISMFVCFVVLPNYAIIDATVSSKSQHFAQDGPNQTDVNFGELSLTCQSTSPLENQPIRKKGQMSRIVTPCLYSYIACTKLPHCKIILMLMQLIATFNKIDRH